MTRVAVVTACPPDLTRGSPGQAPSLESALVALPGADADRRVHRVDEDLAISDIAGLGRSRQHASDLVYHAVRHHHLDLDLGEKIHRVLATAIELRVALLAAESPHLGHRHPDHSDSGQGFLRVVELEGLDDGFDLLHRASRRHAVALAMPGSRRYRERVESGLYEGTLRNPGVSSDYEIGREPGSASAAGSDAISSDRLSPSRATSCGFARRPCGDLGQGRRGPLRP